jgi:hypothetical protein
MPEERFYVPFAMCNSKNQHVIVLNAINDDVFTRRETAGANAKVVFAGAA